jgi:hypothetical protein
LRDEKKRPGKKGKKNERRFSWEANDTLYIKFEGI